jgi:hypothetical protein
LPFLVICGQIHQHADARHALVLLRARRKGPRRRSTDERDEFASFYWITSPADR